MFEPELLTRANGVARHDAEYFINECSEAIGEMSGCCIDIGTGAGDVTVDFILPRLKPNSTLLCSDVSEAMVNYGKERYGNDDRLAFMELDIETPDLSEDLLGKFDHLTSLYCLHWCYDLRVHCTNHSSERDPYFICAFSQAFENIYSLLRPGGTALVTFLANFRGLDTFLYLQAMPKYQRYMKNIEWPRQALMTLLNDVGFQVRLCSCRPMTWIWDTKDNLTEFLLAVNPFKIDDMPADLRSDYMRDITQRFMEHEIVFNKNRSNEDESSILCSYSTFIVYIEKPLP